jgi:hypothetical protein
MSRRIADRIAYVEHRLAHVPQPGEAELHALIRCMSYDELSALEAIGQELHDSGELDDGDGPLWSHPLALLIVQACRMRLAGYTVPSVEVTGP